MKLSVAFHVLLVASLLVLALVLTFVCFQTDRWEKTVKYGCGDSYLSGFFNCDKVIVRGTVDILVLTGSMFILACVFVMLVWFTTI